MLALNQYTIPFLLGTSILVISFLIVSNTSTKFVSFPYSVHGSISEINSSNENSTTSDTESSSRSPGLLQMPYTGLIRSDISPEIAEALGLNETYPGVMVVDVIPDSPADKAGFSGSNTTKAFDEEIVRLGGDIIIQVDYNASIVKDDEAFVDYLENEKIIGDNVTFTTVRDGDIRELNLTLAALPEYLWYTDPDEGIEMKYPSDWIVSDRNLGKNDVIKFFSPEKNLGLDISAAAVIIKTFPSDGITLDELALTETEGYANTRTLGVTGTELSGMQAYESIYYEYGQNRTLKAKSVFTNTDDQFYRINFVADSVSYNNYLPMAEEMIKSFQFINNID
jgi:hypothetical protein